MELATNLWKIASDAFLAGQKILLETIKKLTLAHS